MQEKEATTGEEQNMQDELPEAFAVNRNGLPERIFTLRQKLYLKAKREPKFRFYVTLHQHDPPIFTSLIHPLRDRP